MRPDRRHLLTGGALTLGAGLSTALATQAQDTLPSAPIPYAPQAAPAPVAPPDWEAVKRSFALSPGTVHMSAMLFASHPQPVRTAIDIYRRSLDADPVTFLQDNNKHLTLRTREAAARYFNVSADQVALTDSATMGIGLIYNGLRLRPGQEILTTQQDYYVTHEATRLAAVRTGARTRIIPLYENIEGVTAEVLAQRVLTAIGPATRVIALTWVHSSTGLKIPIRRISDGVAELNRTRPADAQILICLDGVHGVGNQNVTFADLGVDFLMTSCHKWLFGPRGTGVVIGRPEAWAQTLPVIPSFIDRSVLHAWVGGGSEPEGPTTAARMTAGGFKTFEHVWALAQAFDWHQQIGKDRIQRRTEELAFRLKAGLSRLPKVHLRTPLEPELSAGIVSFDVDGLSPHEVTAALKQRKVTASVAPYARPYVRLTPASITRRPTWTQPWPP